MSEGDGRRREGVLVRVLAGVGDLGSPFYAEERQRDVWNEASAVGLQTALWLGLASAAAMPWLGGATGLLYGLVVLGVFGVASWAALLHARAHGLDPLDSQGLRTTRWRMLPFLLLLLAFVAGALRSAPDAGFLHGAAEGALVGAVLGLAGWGLALHRARRRPDGEEAR